MASVVKALAPHGAGFIGLTLPTSGERIGTVISPDGNTWSVKALQERLSSGAQSVESIASSGTAAVALMEYGAYRTADNGDTWTRDPNVSGVTRIRHDGSKFIAVGYNGMVLTSSDDGATWIQQATQLTDAELTGLSDDGRRAVGRHNTVLASPDGTHWTVQRTNPVKGEFRSVAYGAGVFVAMDQEGNAWRSQDGSAWTPHPLGITAGYNVAFGNGRFVTVDANGFPTQTYSSVDGVTWTPSPAVWGLGSVTYTPFGGSPSFLSVGSAGSRALSNPDASSWTDVSSTADGAYGTCAFGDGVALISHQNGDFRRTTDGTVFSVLSASGPVGDFGVLSFGNGIFFAGTTYGHAPVYASHDLGLTWAVVTALQTTIACGYSAPCPQTLTCDSLSSTCHQPMTHTTYAESVHVGVGPNGAILTSLDGATWTPRTSGTSARLAEVAYGNGKFVAVGDNGTLLVSPP